MERKKWIELKPRSYIHCLWIDKAFSDSISTHTSKMFLLHRFEWSKKKYVFFDFMVEKKYHNANNRTPKYMYAPSSIFVVRRVKSVLSEWQQHNTTIVGNVDKKWEKKTAEQSAIQTRLRRVSWKLIINLYCHSNIIVNLSRRHTQFQCNIPNQC